MIRAHVRLSSDPTCACVLVSARERGIEREKHTHTHTHTHTLSLSLSLSLSAHTPSLLAQYAGDPMPHLLIYLKGDLKATIDVRALFFSPSPFPFLSLSPSLPFSLSPSLPFSLPPSLTVGGFSLSLPLPLPLHLPPSTPPPPLPPRSRSLQGANAPKLLKTVTDLLEEFKPVA